MSDTLRAACQLASSNWTLSGEQVLRLYKQVEQAKRALEPNAICGDCQGSGYGGHPDSGAVCSTCHGSGGVYVDPVWQALGATTEAEALERVTILQYVARMPASNPVDRIWLKVGECLAGMTHADVSPVARRKIEAAIKDAING